MTLLALRFAFVMFPHLLLPRHPPLAPGCRVAEAKASVADNGVAGLATVLHGNALELALEPATCMFLFLIKRGLRIMKRKLQELMVARRAEDPCCPPLRVVSYLYRCVFAAVAVAVAVAWMSCVWVLI